MEGSKQSHIVFKLDKPDKWKHLTQYNSTILRCLFNFCFGFIMVILGTITFGLAIVLLIELHEKLLLKHFNINHDELTILDGITIVGGILSATLIMKLW